MDNRKLTQRKNRRRQRNGHLQRIEWRLREATPAQLAALRTIAMENGHTFEREVTRGQAWRRIRAATQQLEDRTRQKCAPPWYTAPRKETP